MRKEIQNRLASDPSVQALLTDYDIALAFRSAEKAQGRNTESVMVAAVKLVAGAAMKAVEMAHSEIRADHADREELAAILKIWNPNSGATLKQLDDAARALLGDAVPVIQWKGGESHE